MNRMMRRALAVAALLLVPTWLSAQETRVTGQVMAEETGQPLAGVQIVVKGTTVGTLTGLTRQVLVFDEPITAGRIWITKLAPGDNGKFDVKLSEVRFFR